MNRIITIGITDCNKWDNYQKWFATEKGVTVLKLSQTLNNLSGLDKCDGLVLSGGEDVHPKYYGHPEWMERKEKLKLDVDEVRDEFEMQVIDLAYKKKLPILGICRGLQIANVYFKGTLIPDIDPENLKQHTKDTSIDKQHTLKIEAHSCLNGIVLSDSGIVNSAHHQAADKIGEGLKVSARSEDGIIEALEIKDTTQHPFLLLVQWHPERMVDQNSRLSNQLKKRFLEEVKRSI